MTNRVVFILAAGKGSRWVEGVEFPHDRPKQLLMVDGETLIGRTVRMVQDRGYDPIVVTSNTEIMRALIGVDFLAPAKSRWLIETLYSTQAAWSDVNVALWSDVLYTDAVLDAMLAEDAPIKFFGRWGDGYGLVWRKDNHHVINGIREVLYHAEQFPRRHDVGRNWELYRWFINCDLSTHIGPTESNEYYEFVPYEDITRDIDTPEDWRNVKALWGIA